MKGLNNYCPNIRTYHLHNMRCIFKIVFQTGRHQYNWAAFGLTRCTLNNVTFQRFQNNWINIHFCTKTRIWCPRISTLSNHLYTCLNVTKWKQLQQLITVEKMLYINKTVIMYYNSTQINKVMRIYNTLNEFCQMNLQIELLSVMNENITAQELIRHFSGIPHVCTFLSVSGASLSY